MKQALAGVMSIMLLCNAGCSHPPKHTAVHDFGWIQPDLGQSTHVLAANRLTVDAPTWLWDNRIRYRLLYLAPTNVRFYGLDLWLASPPELFEQYLRTSAVPAPVSLVIRLLDFEQQFDTPNHARVVVRFSVDAYADNRQHKLGTKVFSLQQATQTPDAKGAIAGFSVLMTQAKMGIQAWTSALHY